MSAIMRDPSAKCRQTQGLITRILKPETGTAYRNNRRPMSLLNTIYKISTKDIANIVKNYGRKS